MASALAEVEALARAAAAEARAQTEAAQQEASRAATARDAASTRAATAEERVPPFAVDCRVDGDDAWVLLHAQPMPSAEEIGNDGRGAVRAAQALADKPAGRYGLDDVFQ